MEELRKIVAGVKSVVIEEELKQITDFQILDISTRILNSRSVKQYPNEKQTVPINNKPTEKQVALLKKLKIKDIEKLTKFEASKLIDAKLNKD